MQNYMMLYLSPVHLKLWPRAARATFGSDEPFIRNIGNYIPIYIYIYIYYIMHIRIYRYIMRSNLFVFLFFLHLHQHSFGFAMVLTCFDPYPYRPCQCSMIQPGKDRAAAAAIHHSHLCRECRGLNMFHQKKNMGNLIPLKFRLP